MGLFPRVLMAGGEPEERKFCCVAMHDFPTGELAIRQSAAFGPWRTLGVFFLLVCARPLQFPPFLVARQFVFCFFSNSVPF